MGDEYMSDMQKENNQETAKEESKRSVVSQAPTLEGKEIRTQSSRIIFREQNDKSVLVQLAFESKDFDWYTITVRIPKSKIKDIYAIPTE